MALLVVVAHVLDGEVLEDGPVAVEHHPAVADVVVPWVTASLQRWSRNMLGMLHFLRESALMILLPPT